MKGCGFMEGRWGERLGAAQDEPRILAAAAGERGPLAVEATFPMCVSSFLQKPLKSAGGRWVTWPVLPGDHAVTKGRRLGHSDPTAGLSGTLHPGEGMRMWLWQCEPCPFLPFACWFDGSVYSHVISVPFDPPASLDTCPFPSSRPDVLSSPV